ncbi:MAG: NAD(P)/FAD-dependent oxidoreductase [Gemmatimonadaceae bacterium]|nr:NAD(P)/FAD-dependent oxidoreductase [Gemmatimonadaceae bacterium]
MTSPAQVVVVGAGPAGSTTAFWLARAGVRVTLLDRARFPRSKACAEYLSPEASRCLDAMGVLDRVEAAGAARLDGLRVRSPDGTVFEGRFVADHGYRAFRDQGLALPRVTLDAILLDAARAAGVQVVERFRADKLVRDEDGRVTGVRGVDASGASMVHGARIVVGADGLRSMVSHGLKLAQRSTFMERYAVVTHYTGVKGIGRAGELHVTSDGYVGLADVGGGLTNVALVVPSASLAASSGDPAAFLHSWLERQPELAPRFARASRVAPVQATGPFGSRARRVWAPGAALVGVAAEYFDPFTGEGIYAALRGGELLAPFVSRAAAADDPRYADLALRGYARAHESTFRSKRVVERLIGAAVGTPWVFNRAARMLARRREMADMLVGVTGDFVPHAEVLRPRFLFDLFARTQ